MQIILFLALLLSILLGAHAVAYVSLVHFFSITNFTHKYVLGLVLTFFMASFFLSSVLARFFENGFTQTYYFLSGFWLGFLVNIILASVGVWLILLTGRFFSFEWDKGILGSLFIGIAFLVSLYGVWNALHPVVKSISVRIPNLPEQWSGQTIVQLSDVHLGHVYRADFLKEVVNKVNALHPKMVVITGDLFDGMNGQLESLARPLGDIIATDGVYFVVGNHETYLGVEKALAALRDTKVIVMNDEVRDVDGIRLIGVSYPSRGEKKELPVVLESLRSQFLNQPNVLLYHAPAMITEAALSGVNLMLSGHTHQSQQFPFRYVTHLVHKGYDYGLYTLRNFSLYTTSGVGTWGPTMRIGTQSEIVAITVK